MRKFWKEFLLCWSVCPSLSLCPQQESQVFALLVSQSATQFSQSHTVSQSATTRPPSAMAGYESAFQAIDETIADCCLRELPWEFSANIWRADPTSNARCVLPKTLSLCRLVISFQLLNTRCSKFSLTSVSTKLRFHKTSFPQNFFATKLLFHLLSPRERMHCVFLRWL